MKKLLFILLLPLCCIGENEVKRTYYPSGNILSEIHYTNGVREGSCKYFWDGVWAIKSAVHYKNGKLIGSSKTYNKEGRLIEEGQYKYSEIGVYSQKDGVWKAYYSSGTLKSEVEYINGKATNWKNYDTKGKILPINKGNC